MEPFDRVIRDCRRRGFNAYDLVRHLRALGNRTEQLFGIGFAEIVMQCDASDNAYHTFCDIWVSSKRLETFLYVIEAFQNLGEARIAEMIRKNVTEILDHYSNSTDFPNEAYRSNIEEMQQIFRSSFHFTPSTSISQGSLSLLPNVVLPSGQVNANLSSIFVSYTWQCRPNDVHALANRLGSSFNIRLADSSRKTAAEDIDDSDLVLVCFSEAYKTRQDCYKELCYADRMFKPIIVVMMHEGVERTGQCWFVIQNRTIFNFFKDETSIDQLLVELVPAMHMLINETKGSFLLLNEPAMPERYQERRGNLNKELFESIVQACQQASDGALIIRGNAEVGKTTVICDILKTSYRELKTRFGLSGVVWLDCVKWRDSDSGFNASDLEKIAINRLKIDFPKLEKLSDIEKRYLFVFDDVYQLSILKAIHDVWTARSWPSFVIMRNDVYASIFNSPNRLSETSELKQNDFEIPAFSSVELRQLVGVTWQLQDKIDSAILDSQVNLFRGNPGTATVWAKEVNSFCSIRRPGLSTAGSLMLTADSSLLSANESQAAKTTTTKLRLFDVPRFEKYYARKEDEDNLKAYLKKVAQNPQEGVFLVLGGGGNGKSTIMSNVIWKHGNEIFFTDECGVHIVLWLNCYQWNKSLNKAEFIQKLLDVGGKGVKYEISKGWKTINDMIRYFENDLKQRILFVLDDCFNESVLTAFRDECTTSPCCAITRYRNIFEETPFIGTYSIGGLSESAIIDMFQTTFKLKDKLRYDQLAALAMRCCGSPLVAALAAGKFHLAKDREIKTRYEKLMSQDFAKYISSKELKHLDRPEEKTAYSLFYSSIDVLDDEQKLHYFSFLLLDPVEPIRLGEFIKLNGFKDENEAMEHLELLEEMSLVKRTITSSRLINGLSAKAEMAFLIHQILHEAAQEIAKVFFAKEGVLLKNLTEVRISILLANPRPFLQGASIASQLVHSIDMHVNNGLDYLLAEVVAKFPIGEFSYLRDCSEKLIPIKCKAAVTRTISTALHVASWHGDLDLVTLIQEAADFQIQISDKFGYTPLALAASRGHLEIVKFLANIWPGALRKQNNDGDTPLSLASWHGHFDLVEYLFGQWPEAIKVKNNHHDTALARAAARGHGKVVKYLATLWPDAVKMADMFGITPLSRAAASGDVASVQYLAECWPDAIYKKGLFDLTPLNKAAESGSVEVIKYLAQCWPEAFKLADRNGVIANKFLPQQK